MRMLHVMLRVTDLDKSIAFYTDLLGMKLLRRKDFPNGKFTLAVLGYDDESRSTVLELTHNWDKDHYELGSAYGHITIGVEDVHKACDHIKANGGKVVREPGPMQQRSSLPAFVEDPDGYKIELLGSK